MTAARAKVLFLGIDAANPGLLRRWGADGTMPNLSALMARGLVGETRSVEGFLVGATWPSLYTGVTPARHGMHYTVQLKPGTYDYHHPRLGYEAFWTALSRAGKRLAVCDVPLTELDPGINGIHLVDWSGIEALSAFQTSPPTVKQDVVQRWGTYPLKYACDGWRRTVNDYRGFMDDLVRGVEMRAELTSHYLAQGGWDLFMQVFTESHCAGHQVWHLHDPAHPAHDAGMAAALGDPIRRLYIAIDSAIGRVLDAAGDALVLVVTAHGMSHWYGAQFILPDILTRLGVAQETAAPPPARGLKPAAAAAARRVWHMLPRSVREAVFPPRARLRDRIQALPALPSIGVDPARSRCFVVRNGHLTGGIRLNLIGREPRGLLAPGAEADAFCTELARDLLEIIDQRTGRPLFRRVVRTRNLYSGDRLDDLPDLLLDWDDEAATGSVHHGCGAGAVVRAHSPKIGVLEGSNHFTRTGDHRIGGIFVAAGTGISPGTMNRTVSILDFAPTLAALTGAQLTGTDGKPISEITIAARP